MKMDQTIVRVLLSREFPLIFKEDALLEDIYSLTQNLFENKNSYRGKDLESRYNLITVNLTKLDDC
jgi:hypothetical protein